MKKTVSINGNKSITKHNIDINSININVLKNIQEELMTKKILLNTSFCQEININTEKESYEKVLENLLSISKETAEENSRIAIYTYIEEENYCIKIVNNKNKIPSVIDLCKKAHINEKLAKSNNLVKKLQGKLEISISLKKELFIYIQIPYATINKI